MTSEEIAEARVLSLAAPTLLALLAQRHDVALMRLIGRFKNGEKDFLTDVAELNTIYDLRREVEVKSAYYLELKDKENAR